MITIANWPFVHVCLPQNLFAILGVSLDASSTDIKKAYHKLARDKHPDKHGNSEEAKNEFQEISTAWNILQKDDARNWYLRALKTEGPQSAMPAATPAKLACLLRKVDFRAAQTSHIPTCQANQ